MMLILMKYILFDLDDHQDCKFSGDNYDNDYDGDDYCHFITFHRTVCSLNERIHKDNGGDEL